MSLFTDRQRVNFESHYMPEPNSGCYLWLRAAAGRYQDIGAAYGVSASYVSLIKAGQARAGG